MGKVFIGNLTDRAEGRDVEDAFRKFGRIKEISLKNGFGKLLSFRNITSVFIKVLWSLMTFVTQKMLSTKWTESGFAAIESLLS